MKRQRWVPVLVLVMSGVLIGWSHGDWATTPDQPAALCGFGNDLIWDATFAKMVSTSISGKFERSAFVLGECYSGGMLDNLVALGMSNTALGAAAQWHEYGWGPAGYCDFSKKWTDEAIGGKTVWQAMQAAITHVKDTNKESDAWGGMAGSDYNLTYGDASKRYAVLFSGDEEHKAEVDYTAGQLVTKGWKKENIYKLVANRSGTEDGYTLHPATEASLSSTLAEVGGKSGRQQFLFLATDHGANTDLARCEWAGAPEHPPNYKYQVKVSTWRIKEVRKYGVWSLCVRTASSDPSRYSNFGNNAGWSNPTPADIRSGWLIWRGNAGNPATWLDVSHGWSGNAPYEFWYDHSGGRSWGNWYTVNTRSKVNDRTDLYTFGHDVGYADTDGYGDGQVHVPNDSPEAATWLLLACSSAAIGIMRRRRAAA